MEYLVNLVREKAGLSDDQARAAANAVMQHFKEKFPHVLHTELDKVADGGNFGDAAKGRFEHLRNDLEEAARNAGRKAEAVAEELKNKFSEMFGSGNQGQK